MTTTRTLALACAVWLVSSATAAAQSALPGRIFVTFNVGAQTGQFNASTTFTSDVFQESATVVVDRTVKAGTMYDGALGVMLGSRFGVAGNFSYWKQAGDGLADATIPHPIFYDRSRQLEGTVTGLRHEETWIAVLGTYRLPATPAMDILLMGGPAVVKVIHELPTSATVSETAAGPDIRLSLVAEERTLWGYHVGADVRYWLTRNFGVGGFARMTGASGNIGDDAKLDLGGFSVGGGLRVRF